MRVMWTLDRFFFYVTLAPHHQSLCSACASQLSRRIRSSRQRRGVMCSDCRRTRLWKGADSVEWVPAKVESKHHAVVIDRRLFGTRIVRVLFRALSSCHRPYRFERTRRSQDRRAARPVRPSTSHRPVQAKASLFLLRQSLESRRRRVRSSPSPLSVLRCSFPFSALALLS
jgi:hypothetical protein